MMSRNNHGVEELLGQMSRDSALYRDIRLVSHHRGEVVAALPRRDGRRLELADRACAVCHDQGDLGGTSAEIVDRVTDLPEGGAFLSVVAPIVNQPGCRSAACHAHASDPPILGFLNADYSLQQVDALAAERRVLIVVTVLGSLMSGAVALWLLFTRLLERPIKGLIAGTKHIAANQLDFRFDRNRQDEIGLLEESFNAMTATIQTNQDELRSAKEYLEGIVENSADIIVTVDPEGLIQTFNPGAEAALGYSRAEVIGRPIEDLYIDPSERRRAMAILEETGNVKNYETRLLSKDGQVRHVLLTLSRLRDREGRPIGTIGISKDVSQEKKLLRELVQSQRFAAIGQAVTGIQHAIKNMLNPLRGGAYLIRNGMAKDNQPRIQEGWTMVEEGIERISDLSHHMLNYAKEWKLELQRVDLNGMVAKICELNRQTAADHGVTLRCEPSDGLPHVFCDPKLIHMAATDILLNAIDACAWKEYPRGESPEVLLKNSLTPGGDFFVIELRDNGCGMNEEIKRNIFTPFFSTKDTRGTGLGLALTARFVKLHRGAVLVESEPERGSAFRIQLPIDGPQDPGESVDGQASSRD